MCLIQILGIIRQLDGGSAFPSVHGRTWTNGAMSSWFTVYVSAWKIQTLVTVGLESLCSVKCLKAVRHNDLTPHCRLCPTRSSSKPEPVCWWGSGGHGALHTGGRHRVQSDTESKVNVGHKRRLAAVAAQWSDLIRETCLDTGFARCRVFLMCGFHIALLLLLQPPL